jgi:alpha-L-fucosidase
MTPSQSKLIILTLRFLIISLLLATSVETPAQTSKLEPGSLQYGLQIQFMLWTFHKPGEALKPENFAPTDLDVKSWARAARLAGVSFAILNVKSASGFCLWNSKDCEFNISKSPVKADIIGDFIVACTAEGVEPGVMYSIPDSYNEGVRRQTGPVPSPYFSLIERHVAELHSRYPGIKLQVFNMADRLSQTQSDELRQITKTFNPKCITLGDTNGFPGTAYEEASVLKEVVWLVGAHLNAASYLYTRYAECRDRGHALLLDVAPDLTGRIPQEQINILVQLKSLIANPPTKGEPGTEPATKAPPAERLKQLKALFDQGLINKEDYDKKAKEIMDAL